MLRWKWNYCFIIIAVRGRLHLRSWCADWMCMQNTVCCIWMQNGCAVKFDAQLFRATLRCMPVHISERFWGAFLLQCTARHWICTSNLIGRVFYCTFNLHSNADDGFLYIQSAHQKRKHNRPPKNESARPLYPSNGQNRLSQYTQNDYTRFAQLNGGI